MKKPTFGANIPEAEVWRRRALTAEATVAEMNKTGIEARAEKDDLYERNRKMHERAQRDEARVSTMRTLLTELRDACVNATTKDCGDALLDRFNRIVAVLNEGNTRDGNGE